MKKGYAAPLGAGAAASLFLIHSALPSLYHKYLDRNVIKDTGRENTVMLTFDDGPDPRYTGKLLDLLAQNEARAAFFVVLENALENEDLVDRMLAEGHRVGFHSCRHQNSMFHSFLYMDRDLRKGSGYLAGKGIRTLLYRPPWGLTNLFTAGLAGKYNMRLMLWSVMAQDWEKEATAGLILQKCRDRIKSGSIVCLHDAGEKTGGAPGAPQKTLEALKILIPELKKKGYRFTLPDEIIS